MNRLHLAPLGLPKRAVGPLALLAFMVACSDSPVSFQSHDLDQPTFRARSAAPFEVATNAAAPAPLALASPTNHDCTFTMKGKTMKLEADCTTDGTIFIPDGMTLDGRKHTITAVNPASGPFLGAVVQNGGTEAGVKNLTIQGSALTGSGSRGPPDTRLRGIRFDGASGKIEKNTVIGMKRTPVSGQEGTGIEVRNAPFDGTRPNTVKVKVKDNVVSEYQKNGITVNGDVDADVSKNTVIGRGRVDRVAQNGIQLAYGAMGKVSHNTLTGDWFTGDDWTASGILIFETNDVKVDHNTVTGSQSGLVVESWCWFAPTADNNKLSHNRVEDAAYGITIDALGWEGVSTCPPSASGNKVDHNKVMELDGLGLEGIFVGTFTEGATPPTPIAGGNEVSHNKIDGYATDLVDSGTNTIVKKNKCTTSSPAGLCK